MVLPTSFRPRYDCWGFIGSTNSDDNSALIPSLLFLIFGSGVDVIYLHPEGA